jgi:ABC-type branched-subunit amino acid transport system substrate-binding protein
VFLSAVSIGVAGCSASNGTEIEGPVTVYVSAPLTGPKGAQGREVADGARLALERAGGKAGDLEVRAEYLDDARGKTWDPAAVGENARLAAQDSSTAVYIGELDSQPTRASAPITNDAGIAQISPTATGVDLTRPAEGYPESPDRYRPSGKPNLARLVPDDAVQAAATADLAAELGLRTVALDFGQDPFGELMRSELTLDAGEVGVDVVAGAGSADAVISPGESNSLLLKPAEGDVEFLVGSVLDLTEMGGPYVSYGYEAMQLALQSIEQATDAGEDFRPEVVEALLSAERPDSALGSYSITEDGDSTLCGVQIYERRGSSLTPRKPVCPSTS